MSFLNWYCKILQIEPQMIFSRFFGGFSDNIFQRVLNFINLKKFSEIFLVSGIFATGGFYGNESYTKVNCTSWSKIKL